MRDGLIAAAILLAAALFAFAMHENGKAITGPFIFGDELEYFAYGRDLFLGASLANHTQYGPLYPAIIAFFFQFGDSESVYRSLRIFNIVVFASSAVPALLLAREMFPRDAAMRVLFPVFAVTTPFAGLGYIIWADPLYYALFLWALHPLFLFFREPRVVLGIASGTLLALLFHAKPGAGIVVEGAAFVSATALLAISPRDERRRQVAPVVALVLSFGVLTLPGVIRNLSLGAGPIGYSYASIALASRIAEVGKVQIAREIFSSIFYQLSYLFVGTWGLLCVLGVMPIMWWATITRELRGIIIFLAFCMAGLMVMSAVGMSSGLGLSYWMPNGRYLSITFPIAVLVGVHLLTQVRATGRRERWGVALAAILLAVLSARTTPLYVLAPYSFVNNTDLALATWVIDKGRVVWRARYDPSWQQVFGFAAVFGAIGVGWALLSKRRTAVFFLFAIVLAANTLISLAEHRYMNIIGESQAGFNDTARFLSRRAKDFPRDVVFDRKLEGSNVNNLSRFWSPMAKDMRYFSFEELEGHNKDAPAARFFVSRSSLALPLEFSSHGLFVYSLTAEKPRR
jgi:hypothetical protein